MKASQGTFSRRSFLKTSTAAASATALASAIGQGANVVGKDELKIGLTPDSYKFGDLPLDPVAIPGTTKLM